MLGTMFSIRAATPADVPAILRLVRLLAAYERAPDEVRATEADLLRDGFGDRPRFECLIAEEIDARGRAKPIGFALYFTSYSTWRGRPGIHLEDLFVAPEWRRRGVARELVARVAARAVEQDFDRLRWDVLEWNQPAIGFYQGLGARTLADWRIMRIEGAALNALAAAAPGFLVGSDSPPEKPL